MARTILIVDSEAAVRKLLRFALVGAGYEVRTASHPREAERRWQEGPIDLLLADVGLNINGHEVARQLALERPDTRAVLMVGWEEECEQCPCTPRCAVIRKPFRIDQLLAAVAQSLGASGAD